MFQAIGAIGNRDSTSRPETQFLKQKSEKTNHKC